VRSFGERASGQDGARRLISILPRS